MELIVIHVRPVDNYPPAINFLRYLSGAKTVQVHLFSLAGTQRNLFGSGVTRHEYPAYAVGKSFRRSWSYIRLYIAAFLKIIGSRKTPIVYFESLSSMPACLYLALFPFSDRKILVHFHEYFSEQDYRRQSLLERIGHRLERMFYRRFVWISHTNPDRLAMFAKNFPKIPPGLLKVMPNFPPAAWSVASPKAIPNPTAVKLVYVGALSFGSTYMSELLAWIRSMKGSVTCDIYASNISDDVLSTLKDPTNNFVTYKGSVTYDELPRMLTMYDIGLVLYNGSSLNFVYNAPNKLFEYATCGLDVWFSDDLISSFPYETSGTYPKILKVNFRAMDSFNIESAVARKGLTFKAHNFQMEAQYSRPYEVIEGG